jgi:hypothetical protein
MELLTIGLVMIFAILAIEVLIALYLWQTKRYLWKAYDKLEYAVQQLNPVLDNLEKEQFDELFKDIEKFLRES